MRLNLPVLDSPQIKSKERVTDHGEVFTSEREVNAMLDLVDHEADRIDSRFLEPACGDGNFLIEILRRKLDTVERKYGKSKLEFERYAVIAVSSIYGIDILKDNVTACRKRLLNLFNELYTELYKDNCLDECRKSVKFILKLNIVCGDALSMKMVGKNQKPIIFPQWSMFNGSMIKRHDYTFESLFGSDGLFADSKENKFIPKSVKEYSPIHFLRLYTDA